MLDMEKVIKGLNDIGGFVAGRIGFEQARNFLRTIDDAIYLLKEQDAVEPFHDDDGAYWCGSCHEDIVWHQKYCSNCGRPVLWEGR
jgi:hypothetical protein